MNSFHSWHDRQFFAPLDREEQLEDIEERNAHEESRACDLVDAILQGDHE